MTWKFIFLFKSYSGNDEKSRSQRMHIYTSLLKQMAPEHLLATFAKVCAEILASASDGTLKIEDAAGLSVLQVSLSLKHTHTHTLSFTNSLTHTPLSHSPIPPPPTHSYSLSISRTLLPMHMSSTCTCLSSLFLCQFGG